MRTSGKLEKLCKALKTIQTIFKNQPGVHIFGSR